MAQGAWEELRAREGEYPADEALLETPWTFWYDKKTSDKKESDQYMEGLRQLGTFGTIEGFYKHYTYLLRPSELPRDHNVWLFRKGYKPMWEEFPEGGCWIVRIKKKVSQSYVNRMWENLLLACIGEEFEMPDVVGCVLSTRIKDDVLSIWNLSNHDTNNRFRIGEKLKEVLDLDMNALIQYKDHMQSLQDYSTYRNARNYMFAPSPSCTPMQTTLDTPLHSALDTPLMGDFDLDQGMLPPAAIDEMLPPAAIDSEAFAGSGSGFVGDSMWSAPATQAKSSPAAQPTSSPALHRLSPPLSPAAAPWYPPAMAKAGAAAPGDAKHAEGESAAPVATPARKSYAEMAAAAAASGGKSVASKVP